MESINVQEIERILQYTFKDQTLLEQAFTHSSYANLHNLANNERMEFFGDAILGFVVSQHLFTRYLNCSEGRLSSMRAHIVSAETLSKKVRAMQLHNYLRWENGSGTNNEISVKTEANLFEAILCAIYLDGGEIPTRDFVLRTLGDLLNSGPDMLKKDAKTLLQEYCQKNKHSLNYKLIERSGPDNKPTFKCALYINGNVKSVGVGSSIKAAEQDSASKIVKEWRID